MGGVFFDYFINPLTIIPAAYSQYQALGVRQIIYQNKLAEDN